MQLKAFLVLVLLILLVSGKSSAFQLTDEAVVSVITCSPGNEAYSVYGHSAIRVKDSVYNYDVAFNYGIFDFSAPNFLYRFASGQTDYLLGVYKFDDFVNQYKFDKRSVFEQELSLTQAEKQKIFDFLLWNAKPENRVYRYNFFFDNCATRIRDVVASNVEGGITFNDKKHSSKTLRELVEGYHGKLLWLTFGIDLAVSTESDREATLWEEMLLPDYLMHHFAEATKTKSNTSLVKQTNTLYESGVPEFKQSKLFGSFPILLVMAICLAIASFRQFKKGAMKSGLDYLVFGITGVVGVVLSWLALYSEHPAMSPNYNLLWALPINFVFVFVWLIKKWRPVLRYYHVFISAWLILFVVSSVFIPQKFHPAFYLLIFMVLSRSVFYSVLIYNAKSLEKSSLI